MTGAENPGNNAPVERVTAGSDAADTASLTAYEDVLASTSGDAPISVAGTNGEKLTYTPLNAAERAYLQSDPEMAKAFADNHKAIMTAFGNRRDIDTQLQKYIQNMELG